MLTHYKLLIKQIYSCSIFKLVESEKSLSGLKLQGRMPLQSLISAFSNNDTVSYDNQFSESLAADKQAIEDYIQAINDGASHQEAMLLTMSKASHQAITFAKNFEGVSASVLKGGNYTEEFAIKQRLAEVSVMATDKSLIVMKKRKPTVPRRSYLTLASKSFLVNF